MLRGTTRNPGKTEFAFLNSNYPLGDGIKESLRSGGGLRGQRLPRP